MSFEPWTVLGETIPFKNRWVQVRLQQVRLPNGQQYEYSIVDRHSQGAAVFLVDEQGRFLLEQEYRHPVKQVVWQLPGGLIDESEPALVAAQRELREETGYEADEWLSLGEFYDNPGLGNASTHLFLARSPRLVGSPSWDEAEEIESNWVTQTWLREAIAQNKIVDRVVLAGVGILCSRGLLLD